MRVGVGLVIACAGCLAHGGPTVGWRPGTGVSAGWQGGVGAQRLEIVGGQSFHAGRPFSYGGVATWATGDGGDPDLAVDHVAWLAGGMVGAGWDQRGAGYVIGTEAMGFAGTNGDASHLGISASLGVRYLGHGLELYATAQAMWLLDAPEDDAMLTGRR